MQAVFLEKSSSSGGIGITTVFHIDFNGKSKAHIQKVV